MARELTNNKGNTFPPTIKWYKPSRFVGVLKNYKDGNFGREFVFAVVEGDVFIGRPNGSKNEQGHNIYAEVDVKPGDLVQVTTSKGGQLESKLNQAIIEEKIEIIFKGKKLNPKSGRSFNDFKVIVL